MMETKSIMGCKGDTMNIRTQDISHIFNGTEGTGYRIKGFIKDLEEEADKLKKRGAKDIRVVSVRGPFGVRVVLRGKG